MRTLLTTTAIVLALSTPADAADCMEDLRSTTEWISQDERNYRTSLNSQVFRQVRKLRDAARLLHKNGQEEVCETVVESINELMEKRYEETAKGGQEKTDEERWHERERARLEKAEPVTQFLENFSAEEIIGKDVRNRKNQQLGEITDMVIDSKKGKIVYAVIAHGGLFGLGDKEIAVPWNRLQLTKDRSVFVLRMTEEQLEKAPGLDRDQKDQVRDPAWRERNDAYYGDQKPQTDAELEHKSRG